MENTMTNQEDIELPIENLMRLQNNVKMAGFGDYFNEQTRAEVLCGREEFSLSQTLQFGKDKVEYRLDIRVDKVKKRGYLNDMRATLREGRGTVRSQSFPHFLRITAKEAYNLLKWGTNCGVEKFLLNKAGIRYCSYITLDINVEKDLYGSFLLMQYHENYYKEPFTIQGALSCFPVQIKEVKEDSERLIAALKRGDMAAVTAIVGGNEQNVFLAINAKEGKLELRGTDLELIDLV